ncbi:hypothetical protein BCU17_08770 [Vibrio splendidus]|uniref:Uncharacterized protein n=1 Tax=Vibrio splendidus TaxID=29497 RepID=A0A2N7F6E4_VIBSP|nr:hypothetical protein [Vibrio splendidus]OMO31270.1 hypothetical protein BH581_01145 [Vibrio splendidus]PMJ61230.1 hypothetical protein BCU17_08770 [Vibrio splendidus]
MQIANMKHVKLEIASHYKLAFPCIKHALESENTRNQIISVQHRLLTYKEVLLHGNMLEDKELKDAFSVLTQSEKGVAQGGIERISDAVTEMDEIIERYSRKVPTDFCV